MAYSEKIFRKAEEILSERRDNAEKTAELHRSEVASAYPELMMLEKSMRESVNGLAKVIGMGNDTQNYILKLRDMNIEAQNEIKNLLVTTGYGEDYLKPKYTCSICSDTGKHDGKLCTCFKTLLRQLSYEEMCASSVLKISTFESFDLSYFAENKLNYSIMKNIFEFCKGYAECFDMSSKSLIMTGETGLGKTHLSLAIAGKAIEKGYGVVYGSVQNLFSKIEREHFGRIGEKDGVTEDSLINCDLLILDDLGAEFTTSFTVATLNNIVNSRLLSMKPTIISTNLKPKELEEKYSRRIVSRILGEYSMLSFVGKDIRQQKLNRQGG